MMTFKTFFLLLNTLLAAFKHILVTELCERTSNERWNTARLGNYLVTVSLKQPCNYVVGNLQEEAASFHYDSTLSFFSASRRRILNGNVKAKSW